MPYGIQEVIKVKGKRKPERAFSIFILILAAAVFFPGRSFALLQMKLQPLMSVYATGNGGLDAPEGVACSSNLHEIVITDAGHSRLLKYNFENDKLNGVKEIKLPQVTYPLRVQLDSKGEIFVLDGKTRKIARLGPEGTFEGYIEPTGLPEPAAFVPKSFKIGPDGDIYILDIMGERVIVLGPDGKFIRQVPFPQDAGFMCDLAVDPTGRIILSDGPRAVLYAAAADAKAFTPLTGSLHEYIDFPANITTDQNGIIYVDDLNGGSVILIGKDGSFQGRRLGLGWNEGLLYFPEQICLDGDGHLLIADRENNRVQIFKIIH